MRKGHHDHDHDDQDDPADNDHDEHDHDDHDHDDHDHDADHADHDYQLLHGLQYWNNGRRGQKLLNVLTLSDACNTPTTCQV